MNLRFVSDTSSKEVLFSRRDFGLLQGPALFVHNAPDLIRSLGVFDDFSVVLGRPRSPEVVRPRSLIAALVANVLSSVQRDSDLLGFDYTYSFSSEPKRRRGGGRSGFRIGELFGGVSARPNGFCTVTLLSVAPDGSGRPVQVIDLRVLRRLETDDWGVLQSHRRSAQLTLPQVLSDLLEFLEQQTGSHIRIQNRW